MIEYCRLNNDYLRFTFGDSIIKKSFIKIIERSDSHKSSIFNSTFVTGISPAALDGESWQMVVGKLHLVEPKIWAPTGEQFFMAAFFHDLAVSDNNDAVGIADSG
jgi:hypothetical protein